MKLVKKTEVPTGEIYVAQGERGYLEFLTVGDYGKDANIKADFLGIKRELNGVPNGETMPLTEKWVVNNGFEKFYDEICEFSYYTKEVDGNYIDIKTDCSNTSEDHVVCQVDNSDRCSIGCADIQYIHQLQNFLSVLNIKMKVEL